MYSELDAGMQFPQAWHDARLVCTLTVMQVAYCLWAARSASLLGHWASAWLSPELIGGRGGAPPAVHSANAYHEQTQLWRETPKNALIRSVLTFSVALELLCSCFTSWIYGSGWSGTCGRRTVLQASRFVPAASVDYLKEIRPWALNLVMATWIWTLPKLDLVRVFLDDCASQEILTKHSV